MDETWQPVVLFPDESPSFVHGFEAGMIWALMEAGQAVIERTCHEENREVLTRMADRLGYALDATATDVPGWADFRFQKQRPAGHLQVVS